MQELLFINANFTAIRSKLFVKIFLIRGSKLNRIGNTALSSKRN